MKGRQLSLFEAVTQAYGAAGTLSNAELYDAVAQRMGLSDKQLNELKPVGRSGEKHNPVKHKVRWLQQTIKHMGLLERGAKRGVWSLTAEGHKRLSLKRINTGHVLMAFSTDLGLALWADCATAFSRVGQPIHLCLTSPPYPLAKPRAYGGPTEANYVDFICDALEPIVKRMATGASLVLNLSNDIFVPGLPSRSLYRERLVLALHDRLGLHKMDEHIWLNRSKPPGPVRWASIERVQLNCSWEAIYWFTNQPDSVRSDNRRVLEPHTERHLRYLRKGGADADRIYSDGAYRLRAGRSYSSITPGRIPRNFLDMGHRCKSQSEYKSLARAAGLPVHGAPFPARLAEFYIRLLTVEGDLVVDPFAGSLTTAVVAEALGRHWIASELIAEYLHGGALRFPGVTLTPDFLSYAA